MKYYLGIDVGTGSARAGIFNQRGIMAGSASHPIQIWRPAAEHVEQSSDDIWRACCRATRAALKSARLAPSAIAGIGFDATCSLVALDSADRPVSVSVSGRARQNVVVWMDHRAIAQSESINRSRHRTLRYVGGVISPEMQMPKLLWLKTNLPGTWRRTARFLDLPDFLTYRSTGMDVRSLCSVVCKWNYLGHKGPDAAGWDRDFLRRIGLGDLADDNFARIGSVIRPMGEPIGKGLAHRAAQELGLNPGTPVGVSIIDAHAGGLGLLGAPEPSTKRPARFDRRLALIGGTSSCHMAVSQTPRFIHGIWGPYHSAMIPGYWLTEGGQTATGALIDHIIFSHPAAKALTAEARKAGTTIYDLLNRRIAALAQIERAPFPAALTRDLHVQPDFLGNRSPRADPTLRGVISGLGLSSTSDDLARLYLATVQAVAYGTRHIIEALNRQGYRIDRIFVCGGGTKNPVFLQEHADITGCELMLPREPEAVLLGSAVLGAVAGRGHSHVPEAMRAMNATGRSVAPTRGSVARYHAAKYRVFLRLHQNFLALRRQMANAR